MLIHYARATGAIPISVVLSLAGAPADLRAQPASPQSAREVEPVRLAQYPGAPFEDRRGNLWFGTVLDGIIRFDGQDFTTFNTKDGLAGNIVRGIVENEAGELLIATSGGLSRFDGERFETIDDYESFRIRRTFGERGDHRELWDVHIDRDGAIWMASIDGVFRHDGEKFRRFPMPVTAEPGKYEFGPRMVSAISEDRDGNLWFGTDGAGAIRYNGDEFAVYTVDSHGLCSDNIARVFQDSRGIYWFGSANGGISRYDGESFTTHLRRETRSRHDGWGRILAIAEDTEGNVWFGAANADGGAYRYDSETFHRVNPKPGIGDGGVPSIRLDRDGNLWFGTTAGVYHYDGETFRRFSRDNPQMPPAIASIDGWLEETFDLPPGFAPELPAGSESLRFSPGWRDPDSDGFWSYAFVMRINEPAPDAERVHELLELYYNGLMLAFARDKGDMIRRNPADIEVTQTEPGSFEASMTLIDAFATFEPIELRVLIGTKDNGPDGSSVSIRISPQPSEHAIWRSLAAAIDDIGM